MPRRRLHLRPALPRRALAWFPSPEAFAATQAFRQKHDPLAARLAPHVTLVFPFESNLGDVQVAAHVRRVVGRWPAIPVRFGGFGHFNGDWVYRRIARGREALLELHDRLYRNAFAPFLRADLPYEPHLTIARATVTLDAHALIRQAEAELSRPDEAVLRELALCRFGLDGTLDCRTRFALGHA
jgi:2'-5' RNA ligase